MKKLITLLIVFILSGAMTVWAEEGMTKKQGDAILKELRQIKALLEKQQRQAPAQAKGAAPEAVDATVGVESPTLGNKNAPLTLVEFTDYECPYCKRFYDAAFSQLKKNYIDTGKLKFVSRNLPLPFHKNARSAAQAALCAGDQGKYWEMRNVIFKNSRALGGSQLSDYARDLNLDMKKFDTCLSSNKHAGKIDADVKEANSVGISGTPSFVLGKTVTKGKMKGEKIIGAQPYGAFEEKIESMLTEVKNK